MANAGARLVAADLDGSAAQGTANAIGAQTASFACDVTDRARCDGLAAAIRSRIFLASEMARYITGVTLPVDGGYLAR